MSDILLTFVRQFGIIEGMKKFEYKVVIEEGIPVQAPFKIEGEEGWELVGFSEPVSVNGDSRVAFIFKREKQE